MPDQSCENESLLKVVKTPFAGRSYRTNRTLLAGTAVLDVASPYAETVYKHFRSEVCAECWRYDGGRRTFLTSRELGKSAGLSFCDDRCKQRWIEREGDDTVTLLAELERARRRRPIHQQKDSDKGRTQDAPSQEEIHKVVNQAWETVCQDSKRTKQLHQWRAVQLDDFEADLARYVLLALCRYAREALLQVQASDAATEFGIARWKDFADLQSGELQQVSKFPDILDNHMRIYQVLCVRFGAVETSEPLSAFRHVLSKAVTAKNVRTALSVDPGNSFGIWELPLTDESEGLGFGVYPMPSFFNHSTSPFSLRRDAWTISIAAKAIN